MATGAVEGVLLAILAVGVGLLAFAAIALVQRRRLQRRINDGEAPLEPGVLAIHGRASAISPDDTVRSPLTGRSALLYEYAVQRRIGSSQTPDWQTVTGGQNAVPFRVETDAGPARVLPPGAGLELPITDEESFVADPDELDSAGSPVDALVVDEVTDTIYIGEAALTDGERYRVIERRIEPGDELTVAGVATEAGAEAEPDSTRDDDPHVTFRKTGGVLRSVVGIPFVIGDAKGGATVSLRNRAIVGVLFGLPLVMLSLAYLFVT